MLITSILAALTIAPALAHVPHDGVLSLAAPPTLDDAAPWWIVVDADAAQVMMRSDDAGRTWQIVASDAISEVVVDMTLFDGLLVYAALGALWTTADGSEWTRHVVDESLVQLAVQGDDLLVATHDGIFTWESDGLVELLPNLDIVQLGVSDAGATAVAADGDVYLRTPDAETFVKIGAPISGAINSVAVSTGGGVGVLVGNEEGHFRVWRDGTWERCGAPSRKGEEPAVVRMAAEGDTWMATTGSFGPLVTTDGCVSWDVQEVLLVVYDQTGSADSPQEAFADLMISGDRVLIAGWAGIGLSQDLTASWHYPPILPAAFVRAVAIPPDFESKGRLYVGAVAANVVVAEDYGATLSAPNHGQLVRDPQSIAVDPADSDRVFAAGSGALSVSDDGGVSWLEVPGAANLAVVRAFADPAEVWALRPAASPGALVSEDGLTGWAEPDGLGDALGASLATDVLRGTTPEGALLTCVISASPALMLCREGDDGAWDLKFASTGSQVTGLLSQAAGDAGPWLMGDAKGIWRSVDTGDSWELVQDTTPLRVVDLVQALDDTLFAFTIGGRVLRSTDLGESWADLGLAIPGGPRGVAVRLAEPPHDQLLVGTPDGPYVIEGALGDASLRPFGGYEVVDGAISWWECRECGDALSTRELGVDTDGAWGDQVTWLEAGYVIGTYLRGERIVLTGALAEGASFSYTVDDPSTEETVASGIVEGPIGAPDALAELLAVDGLSGRLVEVELTVEAGQLGVDYIEGFTEVDALGGGDTGTPGDGGTEDGGTEDGGTVDGGGTDGGGTDGGTAGGDDTGDSKPPDDKCGGCAATASPAGSAALLIVALLPALVRRRRPAGRRS